MERCQITTQSGRLAARFDRRTALRGAGIGSAAVLLGVGARSHAFAQDATPRVATVDYPEVVITAADHSFALPASIPGGLTRLTLRNDGDESHHAMFMRLNDGAQLADLEAALTQPDFGPILGLSESLGGPEVDPGLQATTIVDLEPGQYMVICVIPDADGTPHYMMGMKAPLEVTEPIGTAAAPSADHTIDLVDFAFGVEMPPMTVSAGPQIWAGRNVGQQLHEMIVLQQAPGVSFDQVQAMLGLSAATPDAASAASPEAGAMSGPPFALIGGIAPMNPGYTNWAVLDLEAGDYFLICFVPDPATGAPHAALGMIMPFTVE